MQRYRVVITLDATGEPTRSATLDYARGGDIRTERLSFDAIDDAIDRMFVTGLKLNIPFVVHVTVDPLP